MTGDALGHAGFDCRPADGSLYDTLVEVGSSFDAGRGIAPAARCREDLLPRPLACGIGQLPR